MSAAVLRRAAALMRERATDADSVRGPGAWKADGLTWCDGTGTSHYIESPGGEVAHGSCEEEAIHIASWHPAVALAVATWLDVAAQLHEGYVWPDEVAAALAVARAYLRDAP